MSCEKGHNLKIHLIQVFLILLNSSLHVFYFAKIYPRFALISPWNLKNFLHHCFIALFPHSNIEIFVFYLKLKQCREIYNFNKFRLILKCFKYYCLNIKWCFFLHVFIFQYIRGFQMLNIFIKALFYCFFKVYYFIDNEFNKKCVIFSNKSDYYEWLSNIYLLLQYLEEVRLKRLNGKRKGIYCSKCLN